MRVVSLSPYVPYEGIDHAGGAYMREHIAAVAAVHDVTLFAPSLPANVRAARQPQAATVRLVDVMSEPRSRIVARWWNLRNLARGLTPGWHVLTAFQQDPDVEEALRAAEVVELHWNYLLPLLPFVRSRVGSTPISITCHDVVAQSMQRQARAPSSASRRMKAHLLTTRVRRQEIRYLNLADVAYVFSHKDRALLTQAGATTEIRVIDPWLVEPTAPVGPPDNDVVLFVGAMHRQENAGGVLWFLDCVWPRIKASSPEARLLVAGSAPPPDLVERARDDVTLTGYLDDLDACYRAADVFIAPLLAGAGLKFKVPQAMMYGLPVVTTTIGAEGVADDGEPSPFAAVTDDAAEFADAVLALLRDADAAHRIGRAGRVWAQSKYSFQQSVASVLADYERLTARSDQRLT